ncbi:transcriptional regulator [Candidatus Micrarchaeota archaeon CG10_big_fil_rev_8_21_14_0_10_59_7]|nr:MAG: transcriptional regulator [Candidatus Micrarchaeota archaeon CG10_big_fil_rev_8_21_14_0_10_59_7]
MALEQLKVKIAGEIALSEDVGATIKKWREVFGISQSDLSEFLKITPSTISDYEGNRRKSPGIAIIKRFVDALFEIDIKKGGELVKRLRESEPEQTFFDIVNFKKTVALSDFAKAIEAKALCNEGKLAKVSIFGCTILDSVKVILEMPYESFVKIYSTTSQRALLFTGTTTGRSPMVAVRIAPIKPAVVVLHGLSADRVDKLAVKIAENEGIPLLVTTLSLEDVKKKLVSFT